MPTPQNPVSAESSERTPLDDLLTHYPTIDAISHTPGAQNVRFMLDAYAPPQAMQVEGWHFGDLYRAAFTLQVDYDNGHQHMHYLIRSPRKEDFEDPRYYDRAIVYDALVVEDMTVSSEGRQPLSLLKLANAYMQNKGVDTPLRMMMRGNLPIFKLIRDGEINLETLENFGQDLSETQKMLIRLLLWNIDAGVPLDHAGVYHGEMPFLVDGYGWHIFTTIVASVANDRLPRDGRNAHIRRERLGLDFLSTMSAIFGSIPLKEAFQCLAFDEFEAINVSRRDGIKDPPVSLPSHIQRLLTAYRRYFHLPTTVLDIDEADTLKAYFSEMEDWISYYLTNYALWRMWRPHPQTEG